jgi:flagellin-like protein
MIRKEKRGISPVIATILLILITVAAVSIIWAFVLPFMKEKVGEVDKNVDLSILTEQGFTYFDYANNISSVQVKKGEEDVNITQIIFIFEKQGETKEIRGLFSIPNGQTQTFYIPLTTSYDSVSLAAVVLNGKKEKETGVLQIANFIRGDVPGDDAGVLNGKVDDEVYVKNSTTMVSHPIFGGCNGNIKPCSTWTNNPIFCMKYNCSANPTFTGCVGKLFPNYCQAPNRWVCSAISLEKVCNWNGTSCVLISADCAKFSPDTCNALFNYGCTSTYSYGGCNQVSPRACSSLSKNSCDSASGCSWTI